MRIICLLGKSGGGKSSIEAKLEQLGYNRIISYTTRDKRGNEENGKEYHFVSVKDFEKLIKNGILMEHTIYNGNYYGAPKPIGSINNVIVVESVGFEAIKKIYGSQAIGVYVDTPDEVIKQRLKNRNDTSEEIANSREKEDKKVFNHIEEKVDLVIDGTQSINDSVAQILRYIKDREK